MMHNQPQTLTNISLRKELSEINCEHDYHNNSGDISSTFVPNQKVIQYCYTCRGKIRKYEIKPPLVPFSPNDFSTPLSKASIDRNISNKSKTLRMIKIDQNLNELENAKAEQSQIPTISRQLDTSIGQKYSSYEINTSETDRKKYIKILKCIGCVVNLKLNEGSVNRRTRIQACSISLMIFAILVISFILVNITTPNILSSRENNSPSTKVVPMINDSSEIQTETFLSTSTNQPNYNETSIVYGDVTSAVTNYATSIIPNENSNENSLFSDTISKIRKNIKTYTKNEYSHLKMGILKHVTNKDLSSPKYCLCHLNEVCMLNEKTGTSVCKLSVDPEDPTGCGGLCALETEACQLVDKARGVYMCRLLTISSCTSEQWRCRNGLCVSASSRCDGLIQCYDRSDEIDCECDLTKQFRCGHSTSCFGNDKLCNGVVDCWDGYDELNCTSECQQEQFTCNDGQCVAGARFCDGLADCADRSDEPRGCGDCGRRELRCDNGRCVPHALTCDGRDDCGDGTDEHYCGTTTVQTENNTTADVAEYL